MKLLLKILEQIDDSLLAVIRIVDRLCSPEIRMMVDWLVRIGAIVIAYLIWPIQQIEPRDESSKIFSKICQIVLITLIITNAVVAVGFLCLSIECFSEHDYLKTLVACLLSFTAVFYAMSCIGLLDNERKKQATNPA